MHDGSGSSFSAGKQLIWNRQQLKKKIGKYVMASMITMFLQSAYSMIDGLFVSNLIGDTALSAVNVAWPVIAVVTAIGTGVGCGGA